MRPMLCQTADQRTLMRRLDDDAWGVSEKVDGQRLLAQIDGGKLKAFGRDGQPVRLAPRTAEVIERTFPSGHFVLDGEYLRSQRKLVVFDLVLAGHLVSRETPFAERYEALRQLAQISRWDDRGALSLLPIATGRIEKAELVRDLSEAKAEGVILRRLSGQYSLGTRSFDVLKHKFINTVDAVVKSAGEGGKKNLVLGLYEDGELVEVGKVSALTGDGPRISVGDVVTVRYLQFTRDKRLREATLPRLRHDKAPEECVMDQVR